MTRLEGVATERRVALKRPLGGAFAAGSFGHCARSTAFPQPAPGAAPSPGPMKVADDKLRTMLGITNVTFRRGQQRLAIIDTPLQG